VVSFLETNITILVIMFESRKNACTYLEWTHMSPEHFLRCNHYNRSFSIKELQSDLLALSSGVNKTIDIAGSGIYFALVPMGSMSHELLP